MTAMVIRTTSRKLVKGGLKSVDSLKERRENEMGLLGVIFLLKMEL